MKSDVTRNQAYPSMKSKHAKNNTKSDFFKLLIVSFDYNDLIFLN
jgi:hypothetical protein